MKFEYLSRDLWPIAKKVALYFKKRHYSIKAENPVGDAYRFAPTLVCRRRWETVVVEVRPAPSIDGPLKDFILAALGRREEVTVHVSLPRETSSGEEIALPVSFLDSLEQLGVGLLLVSQDEVTEHRKGAKCSLRFSIPQGRSLGKHKENVGNAVRKFNRGDTVDGLRDLTEIVEAAVEDLATRAAVRRVIIPTEEDVANMDFEGMINVLGAPQWQGHPQHRILDEYLKNDLRSFKGARNLGHHPRTKKEQKQLENQLLERTEASVRLLRELLTRTERCNRLVPLAAPAPPAPAVKADIEGPGEATAGEAKL